MPRGKKQADLPTSDLSSLFGDEPLFGTDLVAGVDEAGRGPLAGPVCAAAVILDPSKPIEGLNDSKKLSAKKREALAPKRDLRRITNSFPQRKLHLLTRVHPRDKM